jgi:hypothetical protein|tara:strand:+ start:2841 stop:2993 length:153 start_codon:yes stop_codon:yes gene_type:complete
MSPENQENLKRIYIDLVTSPSLNNPKTLAEASLEWMIFTIALDQFQEKSE